MLQNKKAAMEMSIGTIVTIVLLMSVMVLGLVLITNILSGANTSVTVIDDKVKSEINNIFKNEGASLAFSPSDRRVTLEQGSNNRGFAFSINNKETTEGKFVYRVFIDPNFDLTEKCGQITLREAESWLLISTGTINIPRSSSNSDNPELILFSIPETAPKCTIPYTINVMKNGQTYSETKVYVTIE